jgi:hypothetical protein
VAEHKHDDDSNHEKARQKGQAREIVSGPIAQLPEDARPQEPAESTIELMAARPAANRPLCALSEAQEIRVRFNGELPAGRAEVL